MSYDKKRFKKQSVGEGVGGNSGLVNGGRRLGMSFERVGLNGGRSGVGGRKRMSNNEERMGTKAGYLWDYQL